MIFQEKAVTVTVPTNSVSNRTRRVQSQEGQSVLGIALDAFSRKDRGTHAHLDGQRLSWGYDLQKAWQWRLYPASGGSQANVALSSEEAWLISAAKGTSDGICVPNAIRALFNEGRSAILGVDASARQNVTFRIGAGKVKRLNIKQICAKGGVQSYGVEVKNVPRVENAADILTHLAGADGWSNTLQKYVGTLQCVGGTSAVLGGPTFGAVWRTGDAGTVVASVSLAQV